MTQDRDRARRAFIRDNHPDRGGDTERFATGLRSFETHRPVVVTGRPRRTRAERLRIAVTRLLRRNRPRVR